MQCFSAIVYILNVSDLADLKKEDKRTPS